VSSLATVVRASVAIPGENFPTDGLPARTLQENRVIAPPTLFTSTQLATPHSLLMISIPSEEIYILL
jgi:hypothetical protein